MTCEFLRVASTSYWMLKIGPRACLAVQRMYALSRLVTISLFLITLVQFIVRLVLASTWNRSGTEGLPHIGEFHS